MVSLPRWFGLPTLLALSTVAVFVLAKQQLRLAPRQTVYIEMQVVLPLFVQVAMTAGDRYLAANLGAIRALWVDNFKMKSDDFKTLAKVQEDVAWLNPGHMDNYYLAAAILAWSGQVEAAQRILARATPARVFDFQPAFFYAFNQAHFFGDYAGASLWMQKAAARMPDPETRLNMENYAANLTNKINDVDMAIRLVERLAAQATRRDFKRYLEVRVHRLKALKFLRDAMSRYREREGRDPIALEDLVAAGIIDEIPRDPFNFGFEINAKGMVMLRTSPPVK